MAGYLKEYRLSDMRAMLRNSRTPHHRSSTSLAGRTALVTGGTSGVGLAAARELAGGGADLILLARDEEKARAVAEELGAESGRPVRFYLADFADLAQVRETTDRLARDEPRLDILVNSAGMHSTRRRSTREGRELVFCVNHLAPFIVTCRLLPLLKRSVPARIVQVSSQGHRFNGLDASDLDWRRRIYTGLRGYGASKTAQLLTVWELSDRLQGSGVTINAMHPGEVRSAIGSNNGRVYSWYKRHVLWRTLKEPEISGESIYYLAADPALDGVSGVYFNLTHSEKPAPHALDREVGRVVWEETLRMTGLSDDL
jgi:retinol dehydrogenase 13